MAARFPFNSRDHYNLSLFNLSIAPHEITSTPTMTHKEGMSSGAPMEFSEHRVETHARETDLSVVYTIDPAVVHDYINNVEQLLARDKYKVVTPLIQSYTNHTRKCVRSRSKIHGKITQHNSRHKLK